jgi:hypothetical protein
MTAVNNLKPVLYRDTPINGQTMVFNSISKTFVPEDKSTNISLNLNDLIGVATTPLANHFLKFDGTNWVSDFIDLTDATSISNVNTIGLGLFKQKVGNDFEFVGVSAGDTDTMIITQNAVDNTIDFNVDSGNIDILDLLNAPTTDVVGINDFQTITNKTIDSTTNNIIFNTSDLNDSNLSSLVDGQVYTYNAGVWENKTLINTTVSSSDNKITVTQTPTDNNYQLSFEAQNVDIAGFPGNIPIATVSNLQAELDGKIEPSSIDTLTNKTISALNNTIDFGVNDLNDSTLTTLVDGQVFTYNSGVWANQNLPSTDASTVVSTTNQILVTNLSNDYSLTFQPSNVQLSTLSGELPISRITTLQAELDGKIEPSSIDTLSNKTIDVNNNNVTNIGNDNIKVGATIDALKISQGIVSNAEFDYLDGLTGNVQDQFLNKATIGGDSSIVNYKLGQNDPNGEFILRSKNLDSFIIGDHTIRTIANDKNFVLEPSSGSTSGIATGPDLVLQTRGQLAGNSNTVYTGGNVHLRTFHGTIDPASIANRTGSIILQTDNDPYTNPTILGGFIDVITGTSDSSAPISLKTGSGTGLKSSGTIGAIDLICGLPSNTGTGKNGGSVTIRASQAGTGGGGVGGQINLFYNTTNTGFILENDGTLSTNRTNYESLVVNNNVVPNKKYVDDRAIFNPSNTLLISPTDGDRLHYDATNSRWVNKPVSIGRLSYELEAGQLFADNPFFVNIGTLDSNSIRFTSPNAGQLRNETGSEWLCRIDFSVNFSENGGIAQGDIIAFTLRLNNILLTSSKTYTSANGGDFITSVSGSELVPIANLGVIELQGSNESNENNITIHGISLVVEPIRLLS